MIYIYTDTTVYDNKAYCTFFIVTDTNFIAYDTKIIDNVKSSVLGELLAIKEGLNIVEKFPFKDTTTVYTDSMGAIQHINCKTNEPKFVNLVKSINALCKSCNARIEFIKGHMCTHNPNKVVDLTSRSVKDAVVQGGVLSGTPS